jgi:hypothetical protein
MKIGMSYSRCVRDIFDGKVDIDEVLVIIARTDFDPRDDEQWSRIWDGYRAKSGWSVYAEWIDYAESDESKFRQISLELYEGGKLHQPRQFGSHASRCQFAWLEVSLPPEVIEKNPAVKAAWEQFQIVAGLAGMNAPDKYNDHF